MDTTENMTGGVSYNKDTYIGYLKLKNGGMKVIPGDLDNQIIQKRNNILSNRNRPNLSFTEKEISKEEFVNLTDALLCIGLFTGGTTFSSLNNPQNNKIQLNNIPFGHIDERYREINSNLIKPASVFTDSNSENVGKLGIEFDNFFDDANIFINFKDYATENFEKTDF